MTLLCASGHLNNIEQLFVSNRNELSDFEDLVKIIKTKLNDYYFSLKRNLEERILNFVFIRNNISQNTLLKKIIKEVKDENKASRAEKNKDEEYEDLFKYISHTQFPLSNHIKLLIIKTLSRKDRKDSIK